MKSEIISVGTELLMGDVINSNAEYISKRLVELGISCYYHTVVGDNPKRLAQTFENALKRSNVIFLTGGLGPTYDDMTKEIVAEVMGLDMVFHHKSYDRIVEIFKQSQRVMTQNNRKQAMIPKGSHVLPNYKGTAPGILIEKDGKIVVLLPGPPRELSDMFETSVTPYFLNKHKTKIISHRIYLFDISESYVEEILQEEMKHYTNPTIAPYSGRDGIHLRITASASTVAEAEALIKPVIQQVHDLFGKYIYSIDIPSLEETLLLKLQSLSLKIATAESCTAGLLSQRITKIPGSSDIFNLGITVYSNEMKASILNVKKGTLEMYGAVSKQVVVEMADNILKLSKADIGVSISGIAGPGGGTDEKPVGTVFVCVKTKDKEVVKQLMLARNYVQDRTRIRYLSASHALKMVLDLLNEYEN